MHSHANLESSPIKPLAVVIFNNQLYIKTRIEMKPVSLSEIKIPPVNIGLSLITKLEIDLIHVNYPSGKKDDYLYFSNKIKYEKKYHMLTFCISKNSIQTAGIITFYKIKN
jgi:hypothetical protein